MDREFESEKIVDNLIYWKKISRSTDRAISIIYVLDVAEDLQKNNAAMKTLLESLSITNRSSVNDPYITRHNSQLVETSFPDQKTLRFTLMGNPGPLSDKQKKYLRATFIPNESKKRQQHLLLRRAVKNRPKQQ